MSITCGRQFLNVTGYKKSVGTVLVTRPTPKGLRIAHYSRTSNAQSLRRMIYDTPKRTCRDGIIHQGHLLSYPKASTVASFLTVI